jgi:hypothetical protein
MEFVSAMRAWAAGGSRRLRVPWARIDLAILIAGWGLSGCGPLVNMETPSPQGPRISRLEFVPDRGTAGCPVTLRFHFEAPTGGIARVIAGWALRQRRITSSGYFILAVDAERLAREPAGQVTAPLTVERHSTYWYYVQVQDLAGHWSNVLKEGFLVDARGPTDTRDCS